MQTIKKHSWKPAAFGALVAIALITAVFVTGLPSELGALSLFPLLGLFWLLQRLTRAEMGFVKGRLAHYGLALLYPLPRPLHPAPRARFASRLIAVRLKQSTFNQP